MVALKHETKRKSRSYFSLWKFCKHEALVIDSFNFGEVKNIRFISIYFDICRN